jgi:cytochrome c oxidase subunit 2
MATTEGAPVTGAPERRHGWWIFGIWFPLALAADLLIWFVLYPHLPPGRLTDQAHSQQFDIAVMALGSAPVLLFVWIYAGYAFITWRHRAGDEEDGPPIHGHAGIQATWIIVTSVIVLSLFVFGTYELIAPAGAGAGEGPSPIWRPANATAASTWTPGVKTDMLKVQVIGQEWYFTYRFPQFGGFETTQLELPLNTHVEFDVTSLDVIHSFWAYQLGVKADANPGVNNIAYATPQQLGNFTVRCNELCGLWHGAMFDYGTVVTPAAFQAWASGMQAKERSDGVLAALPAYSPTYDPDVLPELSKAFVKVLGVTGSPGYYYPPADPVQG